MQPARLFGAARRVGASASHLQSFRRSFSKNTPASISGLLEWEPEAAVDNVAVNGFVRSVRSMKNHRFVSIGDGSTVAPLQAVIPAHHAEGYGSLWTLRLGLSVC